MKRKQFTEEQIITILEEHEAGMRVQDLVRKHSVSEQSIYRWKSKCGGMEVSDAKKLPDLEDENRTVRYDWLAQFLFGSIEEVQDYATR